MFLVRPLVDDALRVVCIAVEREAPGHQGHGRRLDVHDVEAAETLVGAHDIGEAGLLVDGDVVRIAEADEKGRGREHHRRRGDVAQLREIEDLEAVA